MKLALRRFAKSVTVVTTRWQGERLAMSATAVVELSLDPPSLVLCINRTASLAVPIVQGAVFAINVLGDAHDELPLRCIAPFRGEERFALGEWREERGVPVLADAQAWFVCHADRVIDHGTHHVVIAAVDGVASSGAVRPMVYVDGGMFRTVAFA
ncbi:flavin reductase family protein [Sphingomonas naphthae]|uniref:Flavin reductase family protein n=1 Tax=Sphingomonas naphthae TaxID=1813468 RepID=A0ABY7TML7_9SPHN|nr:flavin reductase family protein [Sphingomonas naphthae]WCT74477.1 flavin reductase family protein [Sphingomonas naphthae]